MTVTPLHVRTSLLPLASRAPACLAAAPEPPVVSPFIADQVLLGSTPAPEAHLAVPVATDLSAPPFPRRLLARVLTASLVGASILGGTMGAALAQAPVRTTLSTTASPAGRASPPRTSTSDGLRATPLGQQAARYAKKHAHGDGRHCYTYITHALGRVGIHVHGLEAYRAADQLATHPAVREIHGLDASELPDLPEGAVVVWHHGNGHKYGHISIALGNGREVADIVRPQTTAAYGTSFRVFILEGQGS